MMLTSTSHDPNKLTDAELLDLVPRPQVLPDEDAVALEALREALLSDLAPGTAYETILAEDIVRLEWEAQRERRLRDTWVMTKFQDLAAGLFANGKIIDYPFGITAQDKQDARALVGNDATARLRAEQRLAKKGVSASDLLSEAYRSAGQQVSMRDRNLAELERRRRRLREEYDRLKAARLANLVEDAHVVYEE